MKKNNLLKSFVIIIIIFVLSYLTICCIKFVKIHEINQKANEQLNLSNYYYLQREFKGTHNTFNECLETKVWYNGSKLKIVKTNNNIEEYMILIDYENNKQYYKDIKKEQITERENGIDKDIPNENGLYLLRDNYMDSSNNIFVEILYSLNPTLSVNQRNDYFVIDYKTNQEEYVRTFIDKSLGLPQLKLIEKNNTKTFITYEIEKGVVKEEDFII